MEFYTQLTIYYNYATTIKFTLKNYASYTKMHISITKYENYLYILILS